MKKTLKGLCTITLAFVLLLGLTGCGEEKTNNGGGNNDGGNGVVENKLFDVSIEDYELPTEVSKGVATLDKAYSESSKTAFIKLKEATEDNFNTLIKHYSDNGGTLDEDYSTTREKRYDFSWGTVTASLFLADKEISIEIVKK